MGKVKQIEIKNRTYYFYNDMINLKNFKSNLLKIDKKYYKGIGIYYIGYITIKKIGECENIHRVNALYLLANHASGKIVKCYPLNFLQSPNREIKYWQNVFSFSSREIKYPQNLITLR